MKHSLLLCVAVLALVVAMPASAQYVYMDTNGDGVCNSSDVLNSGVTSIDFYFDTNHNADGSAVTCPNTDNTYEMTINSYAVTLVGTAGITYGAWTDLMNFTINAGGAAAGNDIWLARASATVLPPGKYKVGSLAVTITGNPTLTLVPTDPPLDGTSLTAFGTACPGIDFDNTYKLGSDFMDVCSSASPTPATKTTWGKIKDMYKGQ